MPICQSRMKGVEVKNTDEKRAAEQKSQPKQQETPKAPQAVEAPPWLEEVEVTFGRP